MMPLPLNGIDPRDAVSIDAARPSDVLGIRALVATHALRGKLLRRAPGEIEAHLSHWIVARAHRAVVGCVALEPHRPALFEVRSLAVRDGYQGLGIGSALLEAIVAKGREAVPQLFALTCEGALFARLGFAPVPGLRAGDAFWGRRVRPGYAAVLADLATAAHNDLICRPALAGADGSDSHDQHAMAR